MVFGGENEDEIDEREEDGNYFDFDDRDLDFEVENVNEVSDEKTPNQSGMIH